MLAIIQFIAFLTYSAFTILWWVLIVGVVMSWLVAFNVINTHNDIVRQIYRGVNAITEPLCRPIRRILPDVGGLDLSPLVLLILIQGTRAYLLPAFFGALSGMFGG